MAKPTHQPSAPRRALVCAGPALLLASVALQLAAGQPADQRETLKQSLNQILGQFLELANASASATDHRAQAALAALGPAPAAAHEQRPHQHQHQRQPQPVAPNEISCDELSLVVLAQRVLNVDASTSAISRLIECQHLDIDRRRRAQQHQNQRPGPRAPPPSAAPPSHRRLGHEEPPPPTHHHDPIQADPSQTDLGRPQFIRVPDAEGQHHLSSQDGLHFGAKVSLSILIATILLVGIATLVDFHLANQPAPAEASRTGSPDQSSISGFQHQQGSLRDYRSASVSSSCSSSLFCSSNSVASSSIPILKTDPKKTTTPARMASPTSNAGINFTLKTGESSYATKAHKPGGHPWSASLLEQLLLSFSLRHSVKQIFGLSSEVGCRPERIDGLANHRGKQPMATQGPRSRVASLSSVSEPEHQQDIPPVGGGPTENCLLQCQKCQNAHKLDARSKQRPLDVGVSKRPAASRQNHNESIDALHGIRFLSMIWVIVIHSYNFALRWLFFTNTSTVEGIYKTIASQLLANGSFACDSFFFAGGFLLPYLAIPETISATGPRDDEHQEEADEEEDGSPISSVSSASSSPSSGCSSPSLADDGGPSRPCDSQSPPPATLGTAPANGAPTTVGGHLLLFTCCTCFTRFQWPAAGWLGPHSYTLAGLQVGAKNTNEPTQQPPSSAIDCVNFDRLRGRQRHEQQQPASSCYKLKIGSTVNHLTPNTAQGQDTQPHDVRTQFCQARCETKINMKQPARRIKGSSKRIQNSNNNNNHHHNNINNNNNNDNRNHITGRLECSLSFNQVLVNILHRYIRMMPLMMAIIGLSATLLRYLGEGPNWDDSTMMYDKWCRSNWWINLLFMHNFISRENMCLSHSWYSAVDLQLFLVGQLIMFVLFKSRRLGLGLLLVCLFGSQLITATLTLLHHLPAVPLIASVSEQTMNLYYGEIYIKPYCRASPYLIGLLLAYLMRTSPLGQLRLKLWQVVLGWLLAICLLASILFIMQPAMNGHSPSELQSALYSALSRPLWACATGWMVFACMTNQAGLVGQLLGARCFVPLSRLTYPAFLIHPIVMAVFYGSSQSSFHFSHYLMLYLIIGNIVITYGCAFVLASLFELPLLSIERVVRRRLWSREHR